jgi:hypothetical protein
MKKLANPFMSLFIGKKWSVIYNQIKRESRRTGESIAEIIWKRVAFSKHYESLYQTWLNKKEEDQRGSRS